MPSRDSDYGLVSIPRLLVPLAFGGNPHVVDEVRIRPSSTICSAFRFCLLWRSKVLGHFFGPLSGIGTLPWGSPGRFRHDCENALKSARFKSTSNLDLSSYVDSASALTH